MKLVKVTDIAVQRNERGMTKTTMPRKRWVWSCTPVATTIYIHFNLTLLHQPALIPSVLLRHYIYIIYIQDPPTK